MEDYPNHPQQVSNVTDKDSVTFDVILNGLNESTA